MGIRRLTGDSAGALTYDQAGFDLMSMDHNDFGGFGDDHKEFHAGAGTDSGNNVYKNIPTNKIAHWIGIHNCGATLTETVSVQAVSLVGDNLSKDRTYDPTDVNNWIEILPGDIIFGKFTTVALLRTTLAIYKDRIRLIRGV